MTTYKEIDIENMTQADIRNIILEGDRISIEVEGVEGVLVRTVEQCLNGLRVKLYGVAIIQIRHFSNYGIGMTVTRVERPIPEVELPTVPGYYESAEFPVDKNAYAYQLSLGGQWQCGANKVTEERMREVAPLTRLVPESVPVVDEAALAEVVHRAACGHKCKDESPMRVDHAAARAVAAYLRGESK